MSVEAHAHEHLHHHHDREGASEELAFASAVAGDLELIAILHDREPTAAMIEAMRACPIEQQLGVVLTSDEAVRALAAIRLCLGDMPSPVDAATVDQLAADYADVYLRHTYRVSPDESVWLTEDGLERQGPMFAVRDRYARNNLRVTDWASRPDDHLVLQLRFVAHLLINAKCEHEMEEPTRFLDDHLLRWIKRFAMRLIDAGAPDWYSAIGLLTAAYLIEIRSHLAEITGIAVPVATTAPETRLEVDKDGEVSERPYFPGLTPSW